MKSEYNNIGREGEEGENSGMDVENVVKIDYFWEDFYSYCIILILLIPIVLILNVMELKAMSLGKMMEGEGHGYYREHVAHSCRRAKFHNHKAPGYYMITVSKAKDVPAFSRIEGDPWSEVNPVRIELFKGGGIIEEELRAFDSLPMFEIPNYVIMPDHVHFILRVKEWLKRDVSSRYSKEKREYYERRWEETIRGGGVMVSPFISEAEKKLQERCLKEGGKIIRIVADGIGPRYKPSGREFELCVQGRCLHIGLPRESMHRIEVKRDYCLELNRLAYWIEEHSGELMSLLRK